MAYFECLHEVKFIVDLIHEAGISGMREYISETAKWGDVSVGSKIIDRAVKQRMKKALQDIRHDRFAKEWLHETKSGRGRYSKRLKQDEAHLIESTGRRLRALMPWLQNGKI